MAQDSITFDPGYLEEAIGVETPTFDPVSAAADVHEFWDWGDVGMGLLGAPVELASDLYGLADAVTFDALPDWEASDLVGERTSTAGSLVQSILPWMFAHAKVGKFLSAGARIGKTRYLKGLSSTSEKVLSRAGNIKGMAATRAARETLASSITTASLYEAQDGTLTDLINDVPYLQDIVPDFLESDPEDGEFEARLKAGIEDAGLGMIAGTLGVILKGRRFVRHAQKQNPSMTAEEIDRLADEAISQRELAEAMESDGLIGPRVPEPGDEGFIGPAPDVEDAADPVRARTAEDDFTDAAARVEDTATSVEDTVVPSGPARAAQDEAEDFIPDDYERLVEMAEARREADFGEILNPRERNADGSYKYSTAELFDVLTQRSGMNVKNTLLSTTNPEDMIRLIRAIDERNLERVRGRVVTTEEHLRKSIERMSDFYQVDEAGLIKVLNPDLMTARAAGMSDADYMRALGESAMAHEMTMAPLFDQFKRLMNKFERPAVEGGGNMDDYIEAMRSIEAFTNAANYANDVYSEAGRTLRMRRTPLGGMQPSEIKRILKSQGLDEKAIRKQIDRVSAVLKANKHLGPMEQAAAVAKMVRGSKWRWGDVITEYWVNSILSGPSTHVANILGNSITLALRPLELAGASAITLNSRGVRAAFEQVKSIVSDGLDAMALGLSVEKNEYLRPIGSTKWQGVGKNRNIGRHTLSQDFVAEHPGLAGMVEGVGRLINVPGTALETMDNFFKQLNVRSRLKMRLFDKAFNELGLDAGTASKYVVDEMDRIMENGQLIASETFFQRGLAEGMKVYKGDRSRALVHAKTYARDQYKNNREFIEEAIQFAEEGTFTRSHSKDRGALSDFASTVQRAAAEYWPMRFFIPFVGTPMNLLIFAWDRMNTMEAARLVASPLTLKKSTPQLNAVKSRLKRELMSGDPVLQREAMGRVLMGNAMIISAWSWAQSGKITGRGPADPRERKLWEQAGNQPYSFRFGDKYYSYARLDPFATILGTVADIADAMNRETPDDTSTLESAMHGLWSAVQSNFTQKSFMVGLKALNEAVNQDDFEKASKSLRPIAGGFVPSILKGTIGGPEFPVTGDPLMREVRSLTDVALARIPYFSTSLAPRRNVLGDVIPKKPTMSKRPGMSIVESSFLPIQYSEVKDNSIMQELASMPGTVFYPPGKKLLNSGVDLTEVKNEAGQDAYDRYLELHGIVTIEGMTLKQALKQLFKTEKYRAAASETIPGVPSPRGQMIKEYITLFRSAARVRLFQEYPELRQAKAELQMTSRRQAVAEALNMDR